MKVTRNQVVLFLTLFNIAGNLLFAAQDQAPVALPKMTITEIASEDSLTVKTLDNALKQITLIPGGVDIIDAESYKTGRANTFQDVLGFSPGVYIQPRFGSEESRLSIRGSGIQRTFHLRGMMLLQDGIPINQADGGADFQSIDPVMYRYTEVYRGANALQYGAATLGGAINFVSPSGYDAPALQARISVGSFGYRKVQFSTAGSLDMTDYYISYAGYQQDGFRDHAEQKNHRLSGNVGMRISDDVETRFYLTIADSDSFLPGNLTKAQLNAKPEQSSALANDNKRDFPLYRFSNTVTYLINENTRLEANLFYAWKSLFHPIFQVLDIKSKDYGGHFRLINEAPLGEYRNQFTMGYNPLIGKQQDNRFVNAKRFGNGIDTRGAATRLSETKAVTHELFLENQFYFKPDLALVAGAQYTRTTREVNGTNFGFFGTSTPSVIQQDKIYSGFSPKVGMRWDIADNTQAYSNISRSFEPPSLAELTGSFTGGLANEQTATTFEMGTRGNRGDWRYDLVYYKAKVEGELLTLSDPAGSGASTTANSPADTTHQGLELGWTFTGKQWQWRNSLAWNDFTFDADVTLSAVDTNGDGVSDTGLAGGQGNQLGGIPEWIYRTELLYQWVDGYYAGPTLEWVPEDWAVDHANTLFADRYQVLNFKWGQRLKTGLSWYIEGRNLSAETYAATTGVILNANGSDQAQFLPGDGRSIYVGVDYQVQ